jgi:predicted amino acid racemase
MYQPLVTVNLQLLTENARIERQQLAEAGVETVGVNKVFDGCTETARALMDAGIEIIAESRTYNLAKIRPLGCTTCLLRSPCPSEVDDVVRYADVSLNSEPEVIHALAAAAARQGVTHGILLMVDMGDLREGIWYEDEAQIVDTVRLILNQPNLSLYGLGTNFSCYGAVIPTVRNETAFLDLAHRVEQRLGITIRRLSAGNGTSYNLIDEGRWPKGLNQLRIGGVHQFGYDYVNLHYFNRFHHSAKPEARACSDLFHLRAEVIEASAKPTVPVGEQSVDAFMQVKHFVDHGTRRRVLLAWGRQDVPADCCTPVDDAMQILGQTSDHTLVDVEDCSRAFHPGDTIEFELDYTALLMAFQTSGVRREFIH